MKHRAPKFRLQLVNQKSLDAEIEQRMELFEEAFRLANGRECENATCLKAYPDRLIFPAPARDSVTGALFGIKVPIVRIYFYGSTTPFNG